MAGVRFAATFLASVALLAAPAAASVDRWSGPIAEASARFGIPEAWIRRVMSAESGGSTTRNGRPIESSAGAMGLMQLMPRTWGEMRAALGLGPDPHNPRDNILAGTAYLRAMYDRFGYPGLFAAYNAGPATYSAYLVGRRRLPAETVAYIATVAGTAPPQASSQGEAMPVARTASQRLFVIRGADREPSGLADSAPLPRAPSSLFYRLRGTR